MDKLTTRIANLHIGEHFRFAFGRRESPRKKRRNREEQAKRIFEQRYAEMGADFENLYERVERVLTVHERDVRPLLDWTRARDEFGLEFETCEEVEMFNAFFEQAWDIIPAQVHIYTRTEEKLKDLFVHVFHTNLAQVCGKYRGKTGDPEDKDFQEEVKEGMDVLERAYQAVEKILRSRVLYVETLAIEACLDGVGWTMPSDTLDRAELLEKSVARHVHPVEREI